MNNMISFAQKGFPVRVFPDNGVSWIGVIREVVEEGRQYKVIRPGGELRTRRGVTDVLCTMPGDVILVNADQIVEI